MSTDSLPGLVDLPTGIRVSPDSPDIAICEKTGLALVRASGQDVVRIARTKHGPMNPPVRRKSEDRSEWGRWDVLNHRTIYGGSPEDCSYAEVLAMYKPAIDIQLSDLFDEEPDDRTLEDEVAHEWADRHHMKPGLIPRAWRTGRLAYDLSLPISGWFVDIEAPESIAAISNRCGDLLGAAGVSQLTTAHMHGEHRSLTTAIAGRIHGAVLGDGSYAHGIAYSSKHGHLWRNWAIWLRAVDDGKHPGDEPTLVLGSNVIERPERNPSLRRVMDLFNLPNCH